MSSEEKIEKTGWNLGNTLDCTSYDWKKEGTGETGWIVQWGEKDAEVKTTTQAFETAWSMPVTTQEMVHYVKECGFNAVRIPCTWAEHIDENNQVDPEWMARVHEVVDYVMNEVTDSAENHLIVEVHNYTPQGFCFNTATWTTMTAEWIPWQHEYDLRNDFEMYARWEKRINRPVIIGEYAAFPKKYEDYKN